MGRKSKFIHLRPGALWGLICMVKSQIQTLAMYIIDPHLNWWWTLQGCRKLWLKKERMLHGFLQKSIRFLPTPLGLNLLPHENERKDNYIKRYGSVSMVTCVTRPLEIFHHCMYQSGGEKWTVICFRRVDFDTITQEEFSTSSITI